MRKPKITIKDLAKHLGYSPSTVSRALNDHYSISESVKAKIRLHAMEMGYVLQTTDAGVGQEGAECSVSVVVTAENLKDELLFRTVICEIERAFYRQNVSVNFLIVRPQTSVLSQLKRLHPNGVLVFGMVAKDTIAEIAYSGFPSVFFGTMTHRIRANRITVNNYMGGFDAARHLLRRGHTRIAFLGEKDFSDDLRLRYEGCCDAAEKYSGSILYAENIVEMDMSAGIRIHTEPLQRLLQQPDAPTAAVCANDRIAFALYQAVHTLGKKVPDDLSVVGFDNVSQCEHVTPALTSIHIPTAEMAQEAARLLLSQIQDPHRSTVFMQMDTRLVERGSVASLLTQTDKE